MVNLSDLGNILFAHQAHITKQAFPLGESFDSEIIVTRFINNFSLFRAYLFTPSLVILYAQGNTILPTKSWRGVAQV